MGKDYEHEMNQLPTTYNWAIDQDVSGLASIFKNAQSLILVGSGGSLTSAQLAQTLYQRTYGRLATVMTPMELWQSGLMLSGCSVVLFSAGGRNSDIVGIFENVASLEPKDLSVVCTSEDTPLSKRAKKYHFSNVFEFAPPCGSDGFLATNSLLATSVILIKSLTPTHNDSAYHLPEDFHRIRVSPSFDTLSGIEESSTVRTLLERETIIVLYPPQLKHAAVDIESKFTEAALGNLNYADYRHFAHGRHHWIAKHEKRTGLIAFVDDENTELSRRTVALLPDSFPKLELTLKKGKSNVFVAALLAGFALTHAAGRKIGINPGRPGVPRFGREIYRLPGIPKTGNRRTKSLCTPSVAIRRKSDVSHQSPRGSIQYKRAHARFLDRLTRTQFSGIVFDFDGTLCDQASRSLPLHRDVSEALQELLKRGIPVGVATGRGKSARDSLRKAIPKKYWGRVILGYYNGGQVGSLNCDDWPSRDVEISESISKAAKTLSQSPIFCASNEIEVRPCQITVTPLDGTPVPLVWKQITAQLQASVGVKVIAFRSGHSVDVLSENVSKLSVVEAIANLAPSSLHPAHVLSMGDRGAWPGNDFPLLSTPFSLSVAEVSPDPDSCWNLCPVGVVESQATLLYLRHLSIRSGYFLFKE